VVEQVNGYVGQLGIPGLITLLMGIVYAATQGKTWLTDAKKTFIVLGVGAGAGLTLLFYTSQVLSFKTVADHIIFGVHTGFTSIGLFKALQAAGIVFSPPGQ
jgi:hypothetical protein